MKKSISILLMLFMALTATAQMSPDRIAKREARKNLRVKEWNRDAKGNNAWLDHVTIYDDLGRKIEEIEYANYGMKERTCYFYSDETQLARVIKEVSYDARNKPYRIRKYEYNEDGTRKKQYNYLPNGKLYSSKTFEYIFEDR